MPSKRAPFLFLFIANNRIGSFKALNCLANKTSLNEIARRGSRFGFQIRGSYSLWGMLSDIGQLSYWRRWSDRGQLSYRGVRVTAASCHNGGDRVVRTRSHTGGFLVALVLKREFDFLLFWRKWNFAEGYRIMGQDEWRSDFLCFKSNTNLES